MNHVVYYLRLDDISSALLPRMNEWLKPHGHAMMSVEPMYGAWPQRMGTRCKPTYNLEPYIRTCLKQKGRSFFELDTVCRMEMTETEARNLFKLFLVECLYHHPDYHQGPVTRNDQLHIERVLDEELFNVVRCSTKDRVVHHQDTLWFVIQKTRSKM